jgi:hypothetical protein
MPLTSAAAPPLELGQAGAEGAGGLRQARRSAGEHLAGGGDFVETFGQPGRAVGEPFPFQVDDARLKPIGDLLRFFDVRQQPGL